MSTGKPFAQLWYGKTKPLLQVVICFILFYSVVLRLDVSSSVLFPIDKFYHATYHVFIMFYFSTFLGVGVPALLYDGIIDRLEYVPMHIPWAVVLVRSTPILHILRNK